MGTYTPNYNLYMPEVGETGWGQLVSENFEIIDSKLPITIIDGSIWIVQNAIYNKNFNSWTQPDTNKASTAICLDIDGEIKLLTCASGNTSIVWTAAKLDLSNIYTSTGTIIINGNLNVTGETTVNNINAVDGIFTSVKAGNTTWSGGTGSFTYGGAYRVYLTP